MDIRRIAYVVEMFPKISETFIAREMIELRRRGIEIRVLALERPTEPWHHRCVKSHGLIELTVFNRSEFSDVIRSFRPDIIHAHFATEPTKTAWGLSKRHDIPFTFTAHGYDVFRRPPSDIRERATAAWRLFTVSGANARHLVNTLGVPADKIEIIPCGVPLENAQRAVFSKVPHVVCVARLEPVKNLPVLLQACRNLAGTQLKFRCTIIGDGSRKEELTKLRAKWGLVDLVKMAGALDQDIVWDCWKSASLATLTSDSEGMPVALMEAAACGVPAVATRVGGVPELIEHGITGLLVNAGAVEDFSEAMETLLSNESMLRQFGDAARERAWRSFGLNRQIDAMLSAWFQM